MSLTSSGCTISVMPLGSVLTTGLSVEGGTARRPSALLRPVGQLHGVGFAERDGFLPAEALAGRDRLAGALRRHHRDDGVIEIEIFARDAVDVGDGDLFDAPQIFVRRVKAVERHGIGPDRGQILDGVLLEFGRALFLNLGGGDKIGGHALPDHLAQDRADFVLRGLGVAAGGERDLGISRATLSAADRARSRRSSALPAGTSP